MVNLTAYIMFYRILTSTFEIIEEYKSTFNALELYNLEIDTVPKLLDPFFQKVGLAALVGTSDSGKSTFLRQNSFTKRDFYWL